jgi:UDP-N-acetyl-D-glucosamine dehydrogenase
LEARGTAIDGARVLLVGLAYKPETGDAREAPALRIAATLDALGAVVHAADPYVVDEIHGLDAGLALTRVELTEDEVAAADAVVIVTPHAVFDLEMVARCARYVLDTRRAAPAGDNIEYL